MQGKEAVGPLRRHAHTARAGRIEQRINRRILQIVNKLAARALLHLQPAHIAVGIAVFRIRSHPRRIKRVFGAMDGHERPFAALFHKAVAAPVFCIGQIDGVCKAERIELALDKTAEYAAFAHGGDKRDGDARAPQNVGDVVCAPADGETLGLRMQVFLRAGQMIDAQNDIHARGADNEHIFRMHGRNSLSVFLDHVVNSLPKRRPRDFHRFAGKAAGGMPGSLAILPRRFCPSGEAFFSALRAVFTQYTPLEARRQLCYDEASDQARGCGG